LVEMVVLLYMHGHDVMKVSWIYRLFLCAWLLMMMWLGSSALRVFECLHAFKCDSVAVEPCRAVVT
jgi:hypothetical protein